MGPQRPRQRCDGPLAYLGNALPAQDTIFAVEPVSDSGQDLERKAPLSFNRLNTLPRGIAYSEI